MLSFFANLKIALKIGVTLVLLIAVGIATSVISLTTLTKIEDTARWTAHTHAAIRRLTADNPAQQKRLADLDGQARTWRTDVAEREIALMRDAATREAA